MKSRAAHCRDVDGLRHRRRPGARSPRCRPEVRAGTPPADKRSCIAGAGRRRRAGHRRQCAATCRATRATRRSAVCSECAHAQRLIVIGNGNPGALWLAGRRRLRRRSFRYGASQISAWRGSFMNTIFSEITIPDSIFRASRTNSVGARKHHRGPLCEGES